MSASATDASRPPLNAVGAIWGPPLIGTFIAAILYGISVLQTFYYYARSGKRDGPTWLTLVAVVFILDSTAMALFMYCMYYYVVLSWGMPEMTAIDVKELPAEYIITTILTFIVQNFYINTIRALRAPLIVPVILFLASLAALVTSLILPGVQLHLKLIKTIVAAPLNHIALDVARGTALVCDLGIVLALCWLFATRKSDARRVNNMLDTLIMFSMQRGVLQAIVQAGEVISYAVVPLGIYFLPFHAIVSRIYCNSLLATLNSREFVLSRGRRGRDRESGTSAQGAQEPPLESRLNPDEPSAGWWTSTRRATGPILTSFLAPPFLYSSADSQEARDDSSVAKCPESPQEPGTPLGISVQDLKFINDGTSSNVTGKHSVGSRHSTILVPVPSCNMEGAEEYKNVFVESMRPT